MAETEQKSDPDGDEFFKPLVTADLCASILFYVSAALSFTPVLLRKWHASTQKRAFRDRN
jgi:hypothetical protein